MCVALTFDIFTFTVVLKYGFHLGFCFRNVQRAASGALSKLTISEGFVEAMSLSLECASPGDVDSLPSSPKVAHRFLISCSPSGLNDYSRIENKLECIATTTQSFILLITFGLCQ